MQFKKLLVLSWVVMSVLVSRASLVYADSVYVSLNVKAEVSDKLGDILERGTFFERTMSQPPHITVSKFSPKSHTGEVVKFIDEQLQVSMKKFKDQPLYFYADTMSVVTNPRQVQGNAYLVLKNSTYRDSHSHGKNSEYSFDNQTLTACVRSNTEGQVRFKNFATTLQKLLHGQSKDKFVNASVKRHAGSVSLHTTYPHVTVDRISENESAQYSSHDEIVREFDNKIQAFQTPSIEKDCYDFIRYRVTGYFIQWNIGNKVYKKAVYMDQL